MKLVEAESEGPVEGDGALVTPPRPPHRRVSVSLMLTLSVLIGLVVTIYVVFPPPGGALANEAVKLHRAPPAWELAQPSPEALRAWVVGVLGPSATVPDLPAIGATRATVLEREVAVVRFRGAKELTYVISLPETDVPAHSEHHVEGFTITTEPCGPFRCTTVE